MYLYQKCQFETRHYFKLVSHYRFIYSHEHGVSLSCAIDGCERKYAVTDFYLNQVKRKHTNFYQEHMSKSREQSRNESIFYSLVEVLKDIDFVHDNMAEGVNVVGEIQVDFQKKLGIFLIFLREE